MNPRRRNSGPKLFRIRRFKHVEGKNITTIFFTIKISKGGPLRNSKNENNSTVKHVKFLTEDQAEFVCNKVNARGDINTKTIQQEMNSEKLIDTNPYKKAILDDKNKKKDPTQIEEWSMLSDHVRYVMHSESEAFHKLNIDLMNYKQNKDLHKE